MKKILLFFTALLLTLNIFSQSGSAGDLTWFRSQDTIYISGKGDMPDYSTALSAPNFSPWTGLSDPQITTVVIGEGVTRVGNSAFDHIINGNTLFYHLKTVILPTTLKSIGSFAFRNCQAINEITIPDGVVSIGAGAFTGTSWYNNHPSGEVYAGKVLYAYKGTMPQFTTITLKEGTLGIAANAFSGCNGLTSIVIPSSLKDIGEYAFSHCSNLPEINIPTNLESIGRRAFYSCGINAIVIPEGIKKIDEETFYYCGSLKTVVLPSNLDSIGEKAFYYNQSLKKINIPSKIKHIKNSTFERCIALESVSLPDGLLSIEKRAFAYCSSLPSVIIPQSVTSIKESAFNGCINATEFILPDGLKKIEESTFSECSSLKSINLPKSITDIGNNAFYKCAVLTNITLPNTIINIGNSAFRGCKFFTSINIPNGTKTIGQSAFSNCSRLKVIKIPSSVTNIGSSCFSSCSLLDTVKVSWFKPIPVLQSVFFGLTTANIKLQIPEGLTNTYLEASVWQDFNIIENIDVVTKPNDTEATIIWEPVSEASGYILNIYEDELRSNILFTFKFDKDGNIENGLDDKLRKTVNKETYSYTVTGLSESTTYYYSLLTMDENAETLRELNGEFVTNTGGQTSIIHNNSNMRVSMYLNPISNILYIKGSVDNPSIRIYDLLGQQIMATNDTTIDLSMLLPNTYIVKVGQYSAKLIKK